jgi:hypothetical protein
MSEISATLITGKFSDSRDVDYYLQEWLKNNKYKILSISPVGTGILIVYEVKA